MSYEDSLLQCLQEVEKRQWFVDNAILLIFGALFLAIALFVILYTIDEQKAPTR
jgi:hypothetical protein